VLDDFQCLSIRNQGDPIRYSRNPVPEVRLLGHHINHFRLGMLAQTIATSQHGRENDAYCGAKEKTEAESLAKQFDGLEVKFLRKSGEGDQLFGSVTAGDIAEALEKKSFHIDRRKIQLHEPLKTIGEFIIPIKLHKDVTTHLKVVVDKEAVTE